MNEPRLIVEFVVPGYFARLCRAAGDMPAAEVTMRGDAKGPFFGCVEFLDDWPEGTPFKMTEVVEPDRLVMGGYIEGVERIVIP